jgi:Synergist-CTERM protein sorting domain-containing protein
MPVYRYLKEVDLPTYDLDHNLPFISRGGVTRFFSYQTQDNVKAVANLLNEENDIKVFDYDIQIHARTNALIDGKFDMTLPTRENTIGYMIQKKDGTYEKLTPHSTMMGWNVATITVADHGRNPWTIDVDNNGSPVVGSGSDGNHRVIQHPLPATDDLIGVRIVEIIKNPILSLFKDSKLPGGAVLTDNGIKYTGMFENEEVILNDDQLDGWKIVDVTPKSGTDWSATIKDGKLTVKFDGDVYDEKVSVTLENIATGETTTIEIEFSGEEEGWIDRILGGCNAGFAFLALLALCPFIMRKK